jgi:putative hydrolase of the HAD superfamily
VIVCVFDAVGTLITLQRPVAEVYAEFGRRVNIDLPVAEIEQRFRYAIRRVFAPIGDGRTSESREQVRWRRVVELVFGKNASARRLFRSLWDFYAQPAQWRAYPDVADCLQRLTERKIMLAVASNFDSRLHAIHRGLPALEAIEQVFVSSDIGWRKPHPGFFRSIASALPAGATLWMIGDRLHDDVLPAREAGWNAVWLQRVRSDEAMPLAPDIESLRARPPLVLTETADGR